MNYLALFLVLVILAIVYMVYKYLTDNTLTAGLQILNSPITFPADTLKSPGAKTYSYQAWIYIANAPTQDAAIISRGSDDPKIVLNGQTLYIKGKVSGTSRTILTFDAIPLQKWIYLVVNISNRTVELYLNGKLAKTVVSSGDLTASTTTSITVGNANFIGQSYATKVTRLPSTLDAQTVYNNYMSGNGLTNYLSSLVPYGLNLVVSSGNDVQRSFKLF